MLFPYVLAHFHMDDRCNLRLRNTLCLSSLKSPRTRFEPLALDKRMPPGSVITHTHRFHHSTNEYNSITAGDNSLSLVSTYGVASCQLTRPLESTAGWDPTQNRHCAHNEPKEL